MESLDNQQSNYEQNPVEKKRGSEQIDGLNDWGMVNNVQKKYQELNYNLEKDAEHQRSMKYKDELDRMRQFQNDKFIREKQREVQELDQKLDDIKKIDDYEVGQRQQMRMMNNNLIQKSMDEQKRRNNNAIMAKGEENKQVLARFEAMKQQEIIEKKQAKDYKANLVLDLQKNYKIQENLKEVQRKKAMEMDKVFMHEEREILNARDTGRKNFFDKLRGKGAIKSNIHDYYTNVNSELQNKEREWMENIIEKPAKKRQEDMLEKEVYERNLRTTMNQDSKNFQQVQMRDREYGTVEKNKRRVMEEAQATKNLIEKFDKKETERVLLSERLKQNNLNGLQQQIQERKSRLAGASRMNAQEIQINKHSNYKDNLANPGQVQTGSVPGLGMSYDRKRQLLIIDSNLNARDRLEASGEKQPDPENYEFYDGQNISSGIYDKNIVNQSEPRPIGVSKSASLPNGMMAQHNVGYSIRPKTPKNEFDYIRLKNGQWPGKLDIISNKMRY